MSAQPIQRLPFITDPTSCSRWCASTSFQEQCTSSSTATPPTDPSMPYTSGNWSSLPSQHLNPPGSQSLKSIQGHDTDTVAAGNAVNSALATMTTAELDHLLSLPQSQPAPCSPCPSPSPSPPQALPTTHSSYPTALANTTYFTAPMGKQSLLTIQPPRPYIHPTYNFSHFPRFATFPTNACYFTPHPSFTAYTTQSPHEPFNTFLTSAHITNTDPFTHPIPGSSPPPFPSTSSPLALTPRPQNARTASIRKLRNAVKSAADNVSDTSTTISQETQGQSPMSLPHSGVSTMECMCT